jgi:hypothetical protein
MSAGGACRMADEGCGNTCHEPYWKQQEKCAQMQMHRRCASRGRLRSPRPARRLATAFTPVRRGEVVKD